MGWMSWQAFRCDTDCAKSPTACIDENLYKSTADAMADSGFVKAGYVGVHIDDCWEGKTPERDSKGKLYANATRFPSGMLALSRHLQSRGASLGIYSDEGTHTCGGYPGSEGYEAADAATFAEWEVDYLKLDGHAARAEPTTPDPARPEFASRCRCYNSKQGYPSGYKAMGAALMSGPRPIMFSCSWPACPARVELAIS
jgi:hypothetical protein